MSWSPFLKSPSTLSGHDVCEFFNLGEIMHGKIFYILLRLTRSHWDCKDLTKIAEISPRLLRPRQDCRDLTIFVAFFKSQLRHREIFFILLRLARSLWFSSLPKSQQDLAKILSRFAKTQTSYQHCLHPPEIVLRFRKNKNFAEISLTLPSSRPKWEDCQE